LGDWEMGDWEMGDGRLGDGRLGDGVFRPVMQSRTMLAVFAALRRGMNVFL
jgi:hypothetical protein